MEKSLRKILTKQSHLFVFIVILLFVVAISAQASIESSLVYMPIVLNNLSQQGNTFYVSPTGNDNAGGTSPAQAWATFEHAWTLLQPGDILILLDGTYYQSIHPQNVGEIENPVIIRAQNDGKAIIDGQDERIPVHIEDYRNSYLVIEGIVARNGNRDVYNITGSYNVLRRVSGYDANTDLNSRVFSVSGEYNLVEDCVAAGTGRKMILTRGENVTFRRCMADWRDYEGKQFAGVYYPWGEGMEFYNASNNIIENSISYGHMSRGAFSLLAQAGSNGILYSSSNNKILGSMAIESGMDHSGNPMVWGCPIQTSPCDCIDDPNQPGIDVDQWCVENNHVGVADRPQPTDLSWIGDITGWPGHMSGFRVDASGGIIHNNLLQDILAWGNARYGLSVLVSGDPSALFKENTINRATLFSNGLNNPHPAWGGNGVDAFDEELTNFGNVTGSYIGKLWQGGSTYTTITGEGARLTKRYVDGMLTNEDLWPWPMEERIKNELGYSVTCIMGTIINDAYAQGKAAKGIDMNSRDPNWASDSTNLVVQACNNNNTYTQGEVAEGVDMNSGDSNWASDPTISVVQACNNQE